MKTSENGKANTSSKAKEVKKDLAASYNEFKEFEGQQYTGMKVGRSHKWQYDKGTWKETKLTPDLWRINYAVVKRRAGKAPEGSGVPVGTEYHWYILTHQHVRKLDANSYTTAMTGLKYKLAHKRAGSEKWSVTENGQKKRLIKLLRDFIADLEKESSIKERSNGKPAKKKNIARKKSAVKKKAAVPELEFY